MAVDYRRLGKDCEERKTVKFEISPNACRVLPYPAPAVYSMKVVVDEEGYDKR